MSLGSGSFSVLDYDSEVASVGFQTGVITALNLPGVLTQFGTLRTAIGGIILGSIKSESLTAFNTNLNAIKPSDENAQRERKWLVTYADNTQYFDAPINAIANAGYGKVFGIEIPTADYVGKLLPDSDKADLTDTDIAAFVTAFEALCKSPYGGAAKVLSMTAVGRRA